MNMTRIPQLRARAAPAREQTAADPLAPALRQDRYAQLRVSVLAGEVGRANNREIDISDDKDGATCQVDTFDVVAYTII
jgi:hypothetical protein